MSHFVIRGGRRLSGKLKVSGNKNAVLPMIAACVLTDKPVSLTNVPVIEDVDTMLDILTDLGASVEQKGHSVTICSKGIRKTRIDPALCRKVRSSILFAGPMAARFGRASLSGPGGDIIGRRRLDTHIKGLSALGIDLDKNGSLIFKRSSLKGCRMLLDEASVTATENIIMAAVLAEGETTIFNAACEPHVQDLCRMLNKMGAQITGIGTNYLRISGVKELGGTEEEISPDYIEIGSFIAASAITGGELTLEGIPELTMDVIEGPFQKLGIRWTIKDGQLFLPANQSFRIKNDFGSAVPKIEDGIWPNFPSDLMSIALVLATQSKGTILFFEKLFESRLYFVDRLIEMGAKIVQCDPHRVVVSGPSNLHGIHMSSPDIRAGMSLLLAALCAKGESIIGNAQIIDRGYEKIETRLRSMGADITRAD